MSRSIKPIHTNFCKFCGKEFLPRTINFQFCSDECRDAARSKNKTILSPIECRKCHKTFVPVSSKQVLCHDCSCEHRFGKYWKSKSRIERTADKLGLAVQTCVVCGMQKIVSPENVVENFVCEKCLRKESRKKLIGEHGVFICPICKKEFRPKQWNSIYCSDECRNIGYKQKSKSRVNKRSEERARRHFKETRNCEFCGKPFVFDSYLHNKRFCSNKCRKKAEHVAKRGMVHIDHRHISVAEDRPKELDALREERGPKYFETLFSLPEASQIAEMETWTPEIHAECLEFIGSDCTIHQDDEDVANVIVNVPQRESEVEDEENQSNG